MKKILITGKNSYVGSSFENWLGHYPEEYEVKKISLRDDSWKNKDFSSYDTVLHAAGIVHLKETEENKDLYYEVNRDLAFEVAKKAKDEGVSQFIFLSTMSVYGIETGVIKRDTVPNPKNNYGKSKLEAEKLIELLNDDSFKVAILRPPIIYGKGCKGNYVKLSKLAVKSPIFPAIDNKRSMIFIDNLSEFIKKLVDHNKGGYYYPQNEEYVCTSELVRLIAKYHNKRVYLTKLLNPIFFIFKIKIVKKVFGNLVYEKEMSEYKEVEYRLINFKKSVESTEAKA